MQKKLDQKIGFLKVQDMLAIATILLGVLFLLWKVPYGFGMDDESFYLTIPQRLMQGDSLLTDEWHVSQLSYLFLYIPYKIYILINASTEGIIIYFRYLFVLIQTVMAMVIYIKLRPHGAFSILSAIMYFLHIPLTYMYVNYNSLGLAFVILIGLILYTNKKERKLISYFLGILIACAVLCNPMLLSLYMIFSVMTVVYLLRKKKKTKIPKEIFGLKSWCFITLGCLTMFAIFAAFVLSRTTIGELIKNVPMLFTDIEYQFTSYEVNGKVRAQNILHIWWSLKMIINLNIYLFIAYMAGLIVIIADRKRYLRKKIYFPYFAGVFLGYIIIIISSPIVDNYAYWMMPLTFYSFACYLLCENKNKRMFYSIWLLGVFYAFALDVTADSGPITSTMALTASDIAGVLFIRDLAGEITDRIKSKDKNKGHDNKNKKRIVSGDQKKRIIFACFSFIMAAQLILQIRVLTDFKKISFEYVGTTKTSALNVKLAYGPEKGLITTKRKADIYYGILSDLDILKDKEKKPLFVAENMPFCYLYLNMPLATYSTWYIGVTWNMDIVNKRFDTYYELHPDKIPKYYYVPKRNNFDYDDVSERAAKVVKKITSNVDCHVIEGKEGYILEVQ